MEFVSKYKDIAEFVYFLSGPLLLIGLIIGIYQIKYLKRDLSIRVSRESMLLSVSIMEDKFKDIRRVISDVSKEHFILEFNGEVNGFEISTIVDKDNWKEQYESDEYYEFRSSTKSCLNSLETLAQYIYSGICDEQLCYKLENTLFIDYVEYFQQYIAIARKNEDDPTYEHIIKLYYLWHKRLEHDNLSNDRNKINTKLSKVHKPNFLKVIGKG